jgi:hypothetical protein
VRANRLWYPNLTKVFEVVKAHLHSN